MKKKVIRSLLLIIMCAGFLNGCILFPLKEEPQVVQEMPADENRPAVKVEPTKPVVEPNRSEEVIAPEKFLENEEKNMMYCVSAVNVRDSAGMNSTVIGALEQGDKVTVYAKAEGWIEIDYQGQHGYVYEEYLGDRLNEDSERGEDDE